MALCSLVVLALVIGGRSWPQISFDEDVLGKRASLPELPFTTQQDSIAPRRLELPVIDEDALAETLPVPMGWRRKAMRRRGVLPVDDDLDISVITLPIPMDKDGWKWKQHEGRGISAGDEPTDSRSTLPGAEIETRRMPQARMNIPGVLALPVIHSTKPGVFKRAVEVQLANRSDVAYYAQINIGTPPQEVFVQIDTGSFELWVNPDCTALSDGDRRFCEAVGFYDASASSTSSGFKGEKTLRYGIGAANITYVRDNIGLPGSSTMRAVQFGVATSSQDQFAGILGIGYGEGVTTRYPNFVDNLAAQGVTKTRAFSLAMGSKTDQEGVIVFGGVDTAKFAGPLARLPIIPKSDSPDGVPRYWVQMRGVSLTPPSGRSRPYPSAEMPVFLDSGATLTLLPKGLADAIARDFGSNGIDDSGFYNVDCGLADMKGTLDFEFDGIMIKVPYKEMIRELRTTPPRCYLGVVPNGDFVLLGDTFLRSAYVVFDPDSNLVYMAEYNNCGSQVMSIDDVTMLPSLLGACISQNAVVPATNFNTGTNSASDTAGADSSSPGRTGETASSRGRSGSTRTGTSASWVAVVGAAVALWLA